MIRYGVVNAVAVGWDGVCLDVCRNASVCIGCRAAGGLVIGYSDKACCKEFTKSKMDAIFMSLWIMLVSLWSIIVSNHTLTLSTKNYRLTQNRVSVICGVVVV